MAEDKKSDKKETQDSQARKDVPQKSFKDAPAAHEGKERTEEKTMKGKLHGRDETGAPAPDQADQAQINEEKKQATKEGRHDEMHDRRWPPMQRAMGVVPPANEEEAKELQKAVQEDEKEAEKLRQERIKSSEKLMAERNKK